MPTEKINTNPMRDSKTNLVLCCSPLHGSQEERGEKDEKRAEGGERGEQKKQKSRGREGEELETGRVVRR